jgi:oligopeptide transport system substrate-binding protein
MVFILFIAGLILFACVTSAPAQSTNPSLPPIASPFPTATLAPTPAPVAGKYENVEMGITLQYPGTWSTHPGEDPTTLTWLIHPSGAAFAALFYSPMPENLSLEQVAKQVRDGTIAGLKDVTYLSDEVIRLKDGREAWVSKYASEYENGTPVQAIVASTARGARLFTLLAYGPTGSIQRESKIIDDIIASIQLEAPKLYGIPRDQALLQLGGESNNPRAYDPATGGGNNLVFSGLVTFNPQLQVVPDLAESWDISPDGTVYTFHLRRNARFHDGRPVTAQDVIYSWERAADPVTQSDTVLTYLGDIVGVRDKRQGKSKSINGLKAIDDHTLQVTIDAPKPYFIMKLTFSTAYVVDRANVESGPEWYRTPNGSGPYKLIRWDRFKLQLYERNDDFYLDPPAIRFIVAQLFAGVGIRLYETGDIDITGVGPHDADRVRDPGERLSADLHEGVSMCTSFITFDAIQPPFDDVKVRQAFALAVDKQRYIDVVIHGKAIPARGPYPPALPGYNLDLKGLDFDPALARQRLSESKYGNAEKLPPIVFTSSGLGSNVDSDVAALAQMWQTHLGVTIEVENLESDKFFDKLHAGEHGQLFSYGWCADYADPENFADALFHSDAQQNLGHYANPQLDALLEQARVERDVTRRIQMYQQAEQIIVDDAAGIFLDHSLSFVLVKPHIRGYVLSPIAVPLERWLSIDTEKLEK